MKNIWEWETFQRVPSYFTPFCSKSGWEAQLYCHIFNESPLELAIVISLTFLHMTPLSSLKLLPFSEPSQLCYVFQFIRTPDRAKVRSKDLHNGKNMSSHIFWVIWIIASIDFTVEDVLEDVCVLHNCSKYICVACELWSSERCCVKGLSP